MRIAVVLAVGGVSLLGCLDPRSLLDAPDGAAAPAPAAGTAQAAPSAPSAGYRLVGVVDPDREGMVAFALKVPVGWAVRQSFTRAWDGAVPLPQVRLGLRAPDGSTEIEWRPMESYVWSDGPMTRGLREQRRAMGLDPRTVPNERQPVAGSACARELVVPALAAEGLVITDLRNPLDAPDQTGADGAVDRRGSVDGTIAGGESARVECRIRVTSLASGADTFQSWTVLPSVTRARGDLDAAFAHTLVAQGSIVTNPEWQRLEQETQGRGYAANRELSRRQHEATMATIEQNTAAMTAAHQQRMADIRAQGEANTARHLERMDAMDQQHAAWQERSASEDRQQAYRVAGIREEERYADPTTGEVATVAAGYDQVYRSAEGATLGDAVLLGADTPLDPQQVDWQALRKLGQSEY